MTADRPTAAEGCGSAPADAHIQYAERTRGGTSEAGPVRPESAFPGGTGVTMLDVYDWVAPDGLRGGSAHVHLASTEGYVVTGGAGRLQTLGGHGYAEVPLLPGDCLWFTPGTIHRLINEGGLRLLVVMQNAGLPEAGDAVLTFPPDVLSDPEAYARAASLTVGGPGGPGTGTPDDGDPVAGAARRRRDLAIEGYLVLRDLVTEEGPAALDGFFAAALRLVGGRVPGWRVRWSTQALEVAGLTGRHLDEIASGQVGHLSSGGLWRIEKPRAPRGYGMCGRLTTYPPSQAVRAR